MSKQCHLINKFSTIPLLTSHCILSLAPSIIVYSPEWQTQWKVLEMPEDKYSPILDGITTIIITVYNLQEATFKGAHKTVLSFRCAPKNQALKHCHYIYYTKCPWHYTYVCKFYQHYELCALQSNCPQWFPSHILHVLQICIFHWK